MTEPNTDYERSLDSPSRESILPRDLAESLGVLADSVDRFDLMRAIKRCDELVSQIRSTQLIHSQNLCRVANRLWVDLEVQRERVAQIDRSETNMAEKNAEPDRTERTVWRVTAADVDAIIGREATDDELESMALAAVARLRPTVDRGPQP